MRTILCAVDHSESSLRAARMAASLAAQCKLDLILVQIIRLPEGKQPALANYLRQEHNIESPAVLVRASAEDELARLGERLAAEEGVAITCEVRDGDPATGIVAAASDHCADLIAIGHRGHGRLAQVVLGSVAKRVIETAPCPVLVFRRGAEGQPSATSPRRR